MKVGDKVRLTCSYRKGAVGTICGLSPTTANVKLPEGIFPFAIPFQFLEKVEEVPKVSVESDISDWAWEETIPKEIPNKSARYNSGKISLKEVDPSFILGIAEVLSKSRAKYDEYNWQKPTKISVPMDSLERHFLAFKAGEDLDKETLCHHLYHCATNLMFMLYHLNKDKDQSDDRGFKK